jgi:hypothetical protein
MQGMSATAGTASQGLDHLVQSIRDILTTPVGTRVMRRDYGSRLMDLLDRPTEPGIEVEIVAATAEALSRWEPRFRLDRVVVRDITEGHATLEMTGTYLPDGQAVRLEGIQL